MYSGERPRGGLWLMLKRGLKLDTYKMERHPMNMRKVLVAVLVVAVGLLISVPLAAHHGGASILSGKSVTMKATVKAWLWSNPHCLLTFEVKGEDGKVVQWVAETPAPS